jgi:hypothetical protein
MLSSCKARETPGGEEEKKCQNGAEETERAFIHQSVSSPLSAPLPLSPLPPAASFPADPTRSHQRDFEDRQIRAAN